MGEGVDPTKMCQSLVDKVAQSKLLMAIAEPELLVLFENWLDELEEEVAAYMRNHPGCDTADLAEDLGLSRSGAVFLLTKIRRQEKL
jgi:hypothetical protein